jgi:hypothetical protein
LNLPKEGAGPARRFIQHLRESNQQLGQNLCHEIEHTGGRFDCQDVSARWKHQQRDCEPSHAADRDLKHAIKSRIHRACMGDRRTHNHDDRGKRRHPEARVYRSEQGKRRDRNRESNQKRKFIRRRNKYRDYTGVNRSTERACQIFNRRLQGPTNAHLRHDNRRQYRPQTAEWNVQ